MAEGVLDQVKTGAKDIVKTPMSRPILALTVFTLILGFIVLVELFKPGFFTNPVRKFFGMVGVKGAQ